MKKTKICKKFLCAAVSFSLMFCLPVYTQALAADEITAPSAVLIEPQTGKVLFDKNCHEVRACASITKIMTLLLVFEAIDAGKITMTDVVTASAHAASMGGSDIWLEEGETMTVDEMIKATAVASANDAAVALAEHVSGTEDAFVEEMNKRAKELGMNETTFKNCNGLDEDGHVTSAYDVALMSRQLTEHEEIFAYTSIWMDYLRDGATQIVNTNKLLKTYNGITGLKTGTTGQAGSCISATATRDKLSLIAVVLGAETGTDRFKDAATLLDYGFANFTTVTPSLTEELQTVTVKDGMQKQVAAAVDLSGSFLIKKGSEQSLESKIEYVQEVQAPVEKGQKIGKITYMQDGEQLAAYDITAQDNVEAVSFSAVLALLLKSFFLL